MAPPKPKPVHRQASGKGIIRVHPATADLIDNPAQVLEWDDDELSRGRRKGKDGKFTGRDPNIIPAEAYRELVRRQIARAQKLMATNLVQAVEALTMIASSGDAANGDRIRAANIIIERLMGKNPEVVEVSVKTPLFIGILNGGIVPGPLLPGSAGALESGYTPEDEADIVDAEVVEEEPTVAPEVLEMLEAVAPHLEEDVEWE